MRTLSEYIQKGARVLMLLFLLAIVTRCEQNGGVHHGAFPPQDQVATSPSEQRSPTRIGLNVDGRMSCLLWNNPKRCDNNHPSLTPLFPSNPEDSVSEDSDTQSPMEKNTLRVAMSRLASTLSPGAVFATTDYRFRKERWYGIETIGMMVSWNLPSLFGTHNGQDDGESPGSTALDVSVGRSVFPPERISPSNNHLPSVIDSGNLRLRWKTKGPKNDILRNTEPWIQIGFEPSGSTGGVANRENPKGQPFHLGLFFPLIRKRLDLKWTSRWGNQSSQNNFGSDSAAIESGWSSQQKQRGDDDPWWIPTISLDPSLGILSSENRYQQSFAGENRRCRTEFKLRVRTTMPTLLSSLSGMGIADDDDDDQQTAAIRLDCSLMTDPRNCGRLGATVSTARFETIVVPSFLWASLTETARFGLIHEQHH